MKSPKKLNHLLDCKQNYNPNVKEQTFRKKSSLSTCFPIFMKFSIFRFAIWNTTVGTSLLAMAWGIEKTGLFPAIFINIAIAAICLYTTYTLLKVNEKHGVIGQNGEVCDLCRALIGRWAEIIAKIFSMVVLIGANIVYWILMSNFFYNSVKFFYGKYQN